MSVLDAGFGHGDDPRRVLVGSGLKGQLVVKNTPLWSLLALLRVDRGRIEAECDQLDALQCHYPVNFGPSPVIADAHAEDAAHEAPDRKAEIAWLEIALLQVLMGALRVEFGVARQVHLAVLADNRPCAVDQDCRIEMMPSGVSSA